MTVTSYFPPVKLWSVISVISSFKNILLSTPFIISVASPLTSLGFILIVIVAFSPALTSLALTLRFVSY